MSCSAADRTGSLQRQIFGAIVAQISFLFFCGIITGAHATSKDYDGIWNGELRCEGAMWSTGHVNSFSRNLSSIEIRDGRVSQTIRQSSTGGGAQYDHKVTLNLNDANPQMRIEQEFTQGVTQPSHLNTSNSWIYTFGLSQKNSQEQVYTGSQRWVQRAQERPCHLRLTSVTPHPSSLAGRVGEQQRVAANSTAGRQTQRSSLGAGAAPGVVGAENRPQGVQGRDESLVSDIQRELSRLGFYDGIIDGAYGPRTRRGIEEFQRARSLVADGLATREILASLREAAAVAGVQRQQQTVATGSDEAIELRRREAARLRQEEETRAAADLAERRRKEAEAGAQQEAEARRLRRERDEAEEARRTATEELRRVMALRQELEADLQAVREAQSAVRQPSAAALLSPDAREPTSALSAARAAPTPFSDDFGAVNSASGCLSVESAARRATIFRERYEGKEFAWTGRVRAFFPSLIELDMGTGRSDVVVSLIAGQEALPVNADQRVSIRFLMTQMGTCTAAFRGQRGVILSIEGTSLR